MRWRPRVEAKVGWRRPDRKGEGRDGGRRAGPGWPSLAEIKRALETASVSTLLTKGRRLVLRGEEGDRMKKVWVEDLR